MRIMRSRRDDLKREVRWRRLAVKDTRKELSNIVLRETGGETVGSGRARLDGPVDGLGALRDCYRVCVHIIEDRGRRRQQGRLFHNPLGERFFLDRRGTGYSSRVRINVKEPVFETFLAISIIL